MNACYRAAACKPFLRTSSHKITPNSMLGAWSLPGPRYERPGKNYEALDGKNCHSLGHDQKTCNVHFGMDQISAIDDFDVVGTADIILGAGKAG